MYKIPGWFFRYGTPVSFLFILIFWLIVYSHRSKVKCWVSYPPSPPIYFTFPLEKIHILKISHPPPINFIQTTPLPTGRVTDINCYVTRLSMPHQTKPHRPIRGPEISSALITVFSGLLHSSATWPASVGFGAFRCTRNFLRALTFPISSIFDTPHVGRLLMISHGVISACLWSHVELHRHTRGWC